MASGSSGRPGSGSKGFDFGSDDILCSYDDMVNQETANNGKHSDPATGTNSAKDFQQSRMGRAAFSHAYNQPEDSHNQELISTVERTMKKYADNLLRFLEGISSRLSQLELYCYNLEKSIGEMRTDLNRDNGEADTRLRSVEKHLQEVHRSVQILRDKQELADTQKELAKLQLSQKDSSQPKEEGVAPSASPKISDTTHDVQNQQLALALPHQVNPSMSHPNRSMEQHQPMAPSSQTPPQNAQLPTQPRTYYQQNQLQNMPQDQYLQADPQYQRSQMQAPQQQPQQPPSHVAPPQQVHQFPSHQQQWPQQFPQQVPQQPQQPPQSQIAPQSAAAYPPYATTQTLNAPSETFPGSMPMQVQFSAVPPPGATRQEPVGYGYSAPARTAPQQPQPPQSNMPRQPPAQTQTLQNPYGTNLGDGAYSVTAPHPSQAQRQGYMVYEGEGGRVPPHSMPPQFSQGGYPPSHISSLQNPQPIRHQSPSPAMRAHPYGEMIEKFQSMGYPRDFVASVIHRMEESGQPIDFNSILDRLNMHSSGAPQRTWSG